MTRGGSEHSCTHHGGRRSFPLCLLATGLEKGLASVIGHADRAGPLESYCMGLILPAERKSVEPMAAMTAPTRTLRTTLKITDPVVLPPRTERHIPNSIATMRRRLIVALVNRLHRCPCCTTPIKRLASHTAAGA